ncbi:ATPase [Vibrio phage VBP32]|uniref:ATPase n=2 Tax=Stoningtonvirus VBP47 TaxID=2846606 RepID=M4SLY4_9CAUD|nr:ATPase [Vibrio phage VBP47]YP_007676496.1 ATPase [Vibrio phage VBP32]AGH57033.1 ATPase [Vibrio phage VBP47]AGH57145.1 ATPase [Vibrio phage VBP32]
MQLKSTQLVPLVSNVLQAGLVPMIAGSPGIGKSDLIRAIAKQFNLKVIDHRLSTSDPTDLSGLPDTKGEKATFLPFDIFPTENDEVPAGYDGFLLFLDEINSAPPSVQAASYKVLLDREVGQHKLHEKCACICAGNLQTDGAIVNRLGTAMQSRLVHFEMAADADEWLSWAYGAGIDHRVTSFIAYAPEYLHKFDPAHNDKTFPCPRTWHFLSRYLDVVGDVSHTDTPALAGTIGQGPAREFLTYCEIEKELVTFDEVVKNPKGITLPTEPSTQYFLCGSIASKVDKKTLDKVVEFVERLPIEFQIVCFRDMLKRNKDLKKEKALRDWIITNSKELFD